MAKARKTKESKPKRSEAREQRISMEIVVDAYNETERAMGWYCYLDEKLSFPFVTRCVKEREISPLQVGDEVEVIGMATEDECQREVFVVMRWKSERTLAVPLSQLEVADGDKETRQAVKDWHYWVDTRYGF